MDNIPFHKLDELSTDEYKRLLDVTRNISTGRPNKEFVKSMQQFKNSGLINQRILQNHGVLQI